MIKRHYSLLYTNLLSKELSQPSCLMQWISSGEEPKLNNVQRNVMYRVTPNNHAHIAKLFLYFLIIHEDVYYALPDVFRLRSIASIYFKIITDIANKSGNELMAMNLHNYKSYQALEVDDFFELRRLLAICCFSLASFILWANIFLYSAASCLAFSPQRLLREARCLFL